MKNENTALASTLQCNRSSYDVTDFCVQSQLWWRVVQVCRRRCRHQTSILLSGFQQNMICCRYVDYRELMGSW